MSFRYTVLCSALGLACWASGAHAQGAPPAGPRSPILSLGSKGEMRAEVDKRYEAAVRLSTAPEIVKAPDPRFHDAQDAKVACGIAIGFFKADQIDEPSIDTCDAAYQRMLAAPAPPPPPPSEPPPPPPPQPAAAPVCSTPMPLKVYFGFDVDQPPPEAGPIIGQAIEGMKSCGWSGLRVVGHTDLSGSLGYNQALSERRARNIAAMLTAQGVNAQQLVVEGKGKTSPAVQTADGVKEPLNRRVEISVGGQ